MSYSPPTVAAPLALPWALDRVTSSALAVLRLNSDDIDAARIQQKASVATRLINEFLDLATFPIQWLVPYFGPNDPEVMVCVVPPELYEAAINVTVELYRAKDAPFGVSDAWSADGALVRISSDRLKGIRSLITTHKGRWGIA